MGDVAYDTLEKGGWKKGTGIAIVKENVRNSL